MTSRGSFIHVCPLQHVPSVLENSGARHLVTLLSPGTPFERPGAIDAANHLNLSLHDIADIQGGMVSPAAEHVTTILAFARRWERKSPLLVHCFAGVSRSTATAYIVAAALDPARDEAELALTLRRLSPTATPNARLIALADDMLGRSGRMVDAVAGIGRGADCFEGAHFALPV
ncbi:MAG: tyrosine phosphatase family protein [Rhizobiaceae bacterium]